MKPTDNPSAELSQILAKKIPFEMVAETLFRALNATTVSRSGVIEQDTARQIQAAAIILENRVGRPVARQAIVSVQLDVDAGEGLKERLSASPAARAAIRKLLDETEAIDI